MAGPTSGGSVIKAPLEPEKKKRGRPKKDLAVTAAAVHNMVNPSNALCKLDVTLTSSGNRQISIGSPSRKFDGIQLMDPLVVRREVAAVAALSWPPRPMGNMDVGISGAKGRYFVRDDFDDEEEEEDDDKSEDYVAYSRGWPRAKTSSKPAETAGAEKKPARGRAIPPLGKKPRGRPRKVKRFSVRIESIACPACAVQLGESAVYFITDPTPNLLDHYYFADTQAGSWLWYSNVKHGLRATPWTSTSTHGPNRRAS